LKRESTSDTTDGRFQTKSRWISGSSSLPSSNIVNRVSIVLEPVLVAASGIF
jgi:hypothetical protein